MLLNIWCVLRSLSTAFEKLVESRGDFYVYGEPFADAYLKAKGIMAKDNGDELSFKSISRMLLEKSKGNNVFVKEMAHHVVNYVDDEFFERSINTFLIRDPRLSIPSLYKMLNQYTDEDAGFEQQLELFEMVRKRSGCLPIIIDGEELRQNPAKVVTAYFTAIGLDPNLNSLNWREGSRVDWIGREDWHQQAIKSTTFLPNSKVIDLEKYPPRVRKTVESCLPIYEYMLSFSLHKRLVNSQTSF